MDSSEFNLLGFCSGVGWLEEATHLALQHRGTRARTVAYAERDAHAAAVIQSRMEGESLRPAPIWCGDLRAFPTGPFRGLVDGVVAGFPCQDISVAGRGDGIHGERSGLWFDILRHANDLGCRWLFLENVAAVTIRGLDTILGSLAESGWDAEWGCLQAAHVGAPHKRDRWFCVAHRDQPGLGDAERRDQAMANPQHLSRGQRDAGRRPTRRTAPAGTGPGLEHANGRRRIRADEPAPAGRDTDNAAGEELGNARGEGLQVRIDERGQEGGAGEPRPRPFPLLPGCESLVFPPGPDGDWRGINEAIYPAIKPRLRMHFDGGSLVLDEGRADQLRATGNGVVAIQAAVAFVELLRRFNFERGDIR